MDPAKVGMSGPMKLKRLLFASANPEPMAGPCPDGCVPA